MVEDNRPEHGDVIYAVFIPPEWAEHHIRATGTPSQQLAQEVQKAEVSRPLEDMVPAQYHDFRDIFSKEAFDELPPQKVWDHAIDLSPGTELPHSWTFPLSPAEQKELDNFLQENLVNGHIHPSKSPMGAPVSWYNLPSPSLPTSIHLQPHLPPLCFIHLHSAPTLMRTCTTCTTMSCPLSD